MVSTSTQVIRALRSGLKRDGHCALCHKAAGKKLTFHHLGPKRFKIARAIRYGIKTVRREIEGTCLLCWPCHKALNQGTVDGSALVPIRLDDRGGSEVAA